MGAWRGVSARRLGRFMPRVEIVQKHNTAARRLYIRGHNGKIYPYLVMNDACLTESRREERVLQLLRLLHHFLHIVAAPALLAEAASESFRHINSSSIP